MSEQATLEIILTDEMSRSDRLRAKDMALAKIEEGIRELRSLIAGDLAAQETDPSPEGSTTAMCSGTR